MTLQEYLTSLRHKTVAVIGIGVSNRPLIRLLLERQQYAAAAPPAGRGDRRYRL